jgi:hypothetical protein
VNHVGTLLAPTRLGYCLAELSPGVPLYHWHAGESYLRANRLDDSLAQFSRLLDLDPKYGPKAWFALRSVLGPDVIFQKTVANHRMQSSKLPTSIS